MPTTVICAFLVAVLGASPLLAQDWEAVRALPSDARVRIQEQGADGNRLRGRIVAVEHAQLTLQVRDRSIVVPKMSIGRVEVERRDSLWNGLLIGAVISAVMRVAFAGEACSRTKDPQCTLQGIAVGAGAGAFIDSRFSGHRVIYDAASPTATLLRVSF
jgi:hypothetical protein